MHWLAVWFTDHRLKLEQYVLLNVVWTAAIVLFEVPSGALADVIGRKRLLVSYSTSGTPRSASRDPSHPETQSTLPSSINQQASESFPARPRHKHHGGLTF
jgi:hypothetical protein